MKKKKLKSFIPHLVINTEEGLAAACNEFVSKSIVLQGRKVEMDKKIAALKTQFDEANLELIQDLQRLVASIELFAASRRDLFPVDADDGPKIRQYGNARVGFRTNPHKVEKRISKDTFEAIALRVESLPWGEPYVRETSVELNKEALLRDRAQLTETQLVQAGIRFSQDESFVLEPLVESVEDVRKVAA